MEVSPPHPGDHRVSPETLHGTVDVCGGPAVGEDRHVGLTGEPGAGAQPGRLHLLPSLLDIGIVTPWKSEGFT